MSKGIKKFALLPDSSDSVAHILLKYKVLNDIIKVRFKYSYPEKKIQIKAVTGAVKNPNLCAILGMVELAYELNKYLDKYATFGERISSDMLRSQFENQGLIYPF